VPVSLRIRTHRVHFEVYRIPVQTNMSLMSAISAGQMKSNRTGSHGQLLLIGHELGSPRCIMVAAEAEF
jgi:hypothetical protein